MEASQSIHRPIWAEVSIKRVRANLQAIRDLVGKREIYAVMKADAYGHGASVLAPAVQDMVEAVAVASVEEALSLRQAGFKKRLIVLGYTPSLDPQVVADAKLELTILHLQEAIHFSEFFQNQGLKLPVHIKVDTGMSRLGLPWEQGSKLARDIATLKGLKIVGLFSHLAVSDEPKNPFNQVQTKRFETFTRASGLKGAVLHLANSGGIINLPDTHLQAVRPGILMYGLSPDGHGPAPKGFFPAMRLCSRVADLRTLKKGETVSYGRSYKSGTQRKIATLAAGYADGIPRSLSNGGNTGAEVLVGGERAPIVGRVCMDFLMIDVTHLQGRVSVGQPVTLFGEEGDHQLSAGEQAKAAGTIHYELVSLIGKRVQRIYTDS